MSSVGPAGTSKPGKAKPTPGKPTPGKPRPSVQGKGKARAEATPVSHQVNAAHMFGGDDTDTAVNEMLAQPSPVADEARELDELRQLLARSEVRKPSAQALPPAPGAKPGRPVQQRRATAEQAAPSAVAGAPSTFDRAVVAKPTASAAAAATATVPEASKRPPKRQPAAPALKEQPGTTEKIEAGADGFEEHEDHDHRDSHHLPPILRPSQQQNQASTSSKPQQITVEKTVVTTTTTTVTTTTTTAQRAPPQHLDPVDAATAATAAATAVSHHAAAAAAATGQGTAAAVKGSSRTAGPKGSGSGVRGRREPASRLKARLAAADAAKAAAAAEAAADLADKMHSEKIRASSVAHRFKGGGEAHAHEAAVAFSHQERMRFVEKGRAHDAEELKRKAAAKAEASRQDLHNANVASWHRARDAAANVAGVRRWALFTGEMQEKRRTDRIANTTLAVASAFYAGWLFFRNDKVAEVLWLPHPPTPPMPPWPPPPSPPPPSPPPPAPPPPSPPPPTPPPPSFAPSHPPPSPPPPSPPPPPPPSPPPPSPPPSPPPPPPPPSPPPTEFVLWMVQAQADAARGWAVFVSYAWVPFVGFVLAYLLKATSPNAQWEHPDEERRRQEKLDGHGDKVSDFGDPVVITGALVTAAFAGVVSAVCMIDFCSWASSSAALFGFVLTISATVQPEAHGEAAAAAEAADAERRRAEDPFFRKQREAAEKKQRKDARKTSLRRPPTRLEVLHHQLVDLEHWVWEMAVRYEADHKLASAIQLLLGVTAAIGFTILRDQTELSLGAVLTAVCLTVQACEMASWLLAEELKLAPAVRLVQAFERLESAGLGRAEALVESRVARLSQRCRAQFTAADVHFGDAMLWLRTRLGGGATARLLSARRALDHVLASLGETVRQTPIKSASCAISLVLVVEAACCLVEASLHHIHTEGVGGALAPHALRRLSHSIAYCVAEAAHHGVTALLEICAALITAASTSDFVRARAKKMEFERTQLREKERLKELRRKALERYDQREAEVDNLTPEELRRRRARRERRGNQVAGAIRNARLSVAPGPSAVGPALGRELPRQPQKPPATKGFFSLV